MDFEIDGKIYSVVIQRKPTNQNTYIRVKDDLSILITTNRFTRESDLERILNRNKKKILKMVDRQLNRNEINEQFFYLGKCYDVVYWEQEKVILGHEKIFVPHEYNLDKWYRNQAKKIFQTHLNHVYDAFTEDIPRPTLRIRKMKTRWGVCNTKEKIITLNLELLKRHPKYLDYVIIHELSHLVYPNHSKDFWSVVEKNLPNYKTLRKEMKEY